MWLSVLGVYEWSGNNPLPPEIWLFPYLLPCHPRRVLCHCRMVDRRAKSKTSTIPLTEEGKYTLRNNLLLNLYLSTCTADLLNFLAHSDPFMLPVIGKRILYSDHRALLKLCKDENMQSIIERKECLIGKSF
ncbi:hypothetical protein CMV_010162 [Castanea mollissima]|uniref:Uncharacterized protein n=1 Tax=Castanea mollissima TaxID=60419 RepID=A0A8J4R8H7_9ROSI|nr:hypothetical protein CMV_010162 [Castanea mollissima]